MGEDLLQRRVDEARAELEGCLAPSPPSLETSLHQARTRHRAFVVTVAALLLAAGAVVIRAAEPGRDSSLVAASGDNRDLLHPGEARRLPRSPLSGRSTTASVWTGTEMLVWGGGSGGKGGDGAAYNPRSNTWRKLPASPLGTRHAPAAVWTGTEMLLWGGADAKNVSYADGAAFNPAAGTWRRIAEAPIRSAASLGVWTGRELVVLAGLTQVNSHRVAAYDPSTDTWRSLPDKPAQLHTPHAAVWTGSRVVVALQAGLGGRIGIFSLDPAGGGWTELPRLGDGQILLTWAGDRLLAVIGSVAAVLDPATNRWAGVAQAPQDLERSGSDEAVAWTGNELVLWSGGAHASVIDPARGTWRTTPAGGLERRFQPAAVWADGVFLGWGGFDRTDGVMLRPIESSAVGSEPPALPDAGERPADLVPAGGLGGQGTFDRNGPPASWNGRSLPVLPVRDATGNVVGYFGCRFLERSEVEREDFGVGVGCPFDATKSPGP